MNEPGRRNLAMGILETTDAQGRAARRTRALSYALVAVVVGLALLALTA